MWKEKGFTLFELLVVIAVLGIMFVSVPIAISPFQESRHAEIAVGATAQALRRAQMLSTAVSSDSTWGASIQAGSVVVFQGSSYATRNATFDETFEIPQDVTVTGTTQFVFQKLSGEPGTAGVVTLETPHRSKAITVNTYGAILYQ